MPTLEVSDEVLELLESYRRSKRLSREEALKVALKGEAQHPESDRARLTAAGVPYTGDPETDAVLNDFPDILERIRRLEAGEEELIPIEDVMAEFGITRAKRRRKAKESA